MLSPEEMAEIITTRSERGFTTAVNDIEHMESHLADRHQRHPNLFPSERQD